jgi:hypothetical protein
MNAMLVSHFQREATVRLNSAEHDLVSFMKSCRGKVIDFHEMNHIRLLRDRVDKARLRQLRWTRYRFLVESGVN